MFQKEDRALATIASELSRIGEVVQAIAFGSRVRGDFREDSDFDVLVIVNHKNVEIKNAVIEVFYNVELESGILFSITLMSKEELERNLQMGSPFLRSVLQEGVIFYDIDRRREKDAVRTSS